jgi:DNA-binding PadR family transcriptional regulator
VDDDRRCRVDAGRGLPGHALAGYVRPEHIVSHGLGDLEQLVLLAVVRLSGKAYAVSVRLEIEGLTGRQTSRGAVYVTLGRMEQKGYLRSELSEPTPERGGKAKRMFTITGAGTEVLRETVRGLQAMLDGIERDLAWGKGS